MARLEVAINSPLAFSRRFAQPIESDELEEVFAQGPDTIGVEFRDRLFVWHAFPSPDRPGPGKEDAGPTVTVLVGDDEDAVRAADDAQRFVSAIAFYHQEPAETLYAQVTDITEDYTSAVNRAPRTTRWGWTLARSPTTITLRTEANVQLAIAYYREELNAGSPFFGFLAFWNSLEATFSVPERGRKGRGAAITARNDFIRAFALNARKAWRPDIPFPTDLADALEGDSRHAIAHVLRRPGERTIDPDVSADRARAYEWRLTCSSGWPMPRG
jgi:hypothetical protein